MRIASLGDPPETGPALLALPLHGAPGDVLETIDVLLVSGSSWIRGYSEQVARLTAGGVPELSLRGSELLFASLRRWRLTLSPWLESGGIMLVDVSTPGTLRAHTVERVSAIDVGSYLAAGPHYALAPRHSHEAPRAVSGPPFRTLIEDLMPVLRISHAMRDHRGRALLECRGECVAFHLGRSAGHILYLPLPPGAWDAALPFLAAFASTLRRGRPSRVPRWVDRIVAPEDLSAYRDADSLAREQEALERRRRDSRAALSRARRGRRVVFAEGRELWESVLEIFSSAGCAVTQGTTADADLWVESGSRRYRVALYSGRPAFEAFLDELAPASLLVLANEQDIEPHLRYDALGEWSALARACGVALATTLDLFALHHDGSVARLLGADGRPAWVAEWREVLVGRPIQPPPRGEPSGGCGAAH